MKFVVPFLLLAAGSVSLASAQTNVGVSVSVAQPGVYGRIDIGNVAPPPVVYAQPVIIEQPARVVVHQQPLYLYVPPGHQKHWAKHCGGYNACGQPVYFVKETWVRERYEEHHHRHDDGDRKERKHKGKHGGD
ncbi:MAG: hypothetical protein JF606_12495 [Burkholderiales bacterium]|jgi:hypothetical protein|nr:hypothetical protein [Burkholderiales bacterium]